MSDVWQRIVARLEERMARAAREASPPASRFKVRSAEPLIVEEVNGELILEEGDDDFEVEEGLKGVRPEPGDLVVVDTDQHGDFIARGVLKGA